MEKSDEVTLTIDGIEVSVPKNTLVIRAAEHIGVQIPRFCDHPLLAPVGACRQCLVVVADAGNGRPINMPGTDKPKPGSSDGLKRQTKEELLDRAKKLDIEGRSKTTKDELVEAIAAAE